MPSLHPEPGEGLSEAERLRLLAVAREALERAARDRRRWAPEAGPAPALREPRACFVSLHKNGQLRGCVGQVVARLPLAQAVAEAAFSAALEDPRFSPVEPEEVPEIAIEISALSPFRPIRAEEVEIGRHGLLITRDRTRGLLLPQVPLEYGWDRHRYLAELCRKAGLEPEAWAHGAQLQAFTAEVFGESSDSL